MIFLPVNTFKFEVQRSLKLHIKWIILKFKIHKETISAKLSIFTYDAPIIFFHATALISAHFTEQSKNGTPLVMNRSNRHGFIQALFHVMDISEIISILEFCSKTPCLVDWTIKTLIRKKMSLVTSTPSKTVCKIFLLFHEASVLYVGDSLYFQ